MYYKSNLNYDIAVRNGERKLLNLESLRIPCVASNNEELVAIIKTIIQKLCLDSSGCDKNHVPYYIETSVYDLLSKSYVGMQGISLKLLDKSVIKWAKEAEYRFDCIYAENDITDNVLSMLKKNNQENEPEIKNVSVVFIHKPKPFCNVCKYRITYRNGQIAYVDKIAEICRNL